ncbi:MAG TPA: tetratricopeptide repeat protein [Candidatus Acidoferrum sp.]|nr:tetratricopeptide repeat protein [Candidatus Acidoferrum sp.]
MKRLIFICVAIATLALPVTMRAAALVDDETAALVRGFTNDLKHGQKRTNDVTAPVVTHAAPLFHTNEALRDSTVALHTTNLLSKDTVAQKQQDRSAELRALQERLEIARRQRLQRSFAEAVPTLISLVLANAPDEMKRTALLELAIIAQEENDLAKAQQIFAHFLAKWPNDPSAPEVLLRQGLVFRQMGLNSRALIKFYAVMTSSLVLKADQLEYYQRLVLQAQTEIAETYFQQGKFAESVEYLSRLLKQNAPSLNKPQIHFKVVRSLSALGRFEDVASQAYEFLDRYQDAVEQPEVRFHLATALKRLGRNTDSLQQVLVLLQDQKSHASSQPEAWAHWQQRTGNEIANQLYKEGDYLAALQVYSGLAQLNTNAAWQLPVWYQIGLTFERLEQPVKALGEYSRIVQRESEVATNSANLRTIIDMARWRAQFIGWQTNTQTIPREFKTAQPITPFATLAKP